MREVFSDFMKLERRPDGTVRIWLGTEQPSNDLAGLTDGGRIRVVYPGELMAEGVAESEHGNGWTTWYAIVPSMDAIVSLYDEGPSDETHAPAGAVQE